MKKLLQRSWQKRGCRSRKEIFAAKWEIDLVAQDGRYLVFIEVKYRKNGKSGSPFSAVGREKQRIISKVAMFYLIAHGYRELPPCRFDVVGIDGENIHWIKNAFDFCS